MKKYKNFFIKIFFFMLTMMMATSVYGTNFIPRYTAPDISDYHYYSYNNPFYPKYGMPNCTCYAWGRAYELLGDKPNLSTGNAGEWFEYNKRNGYYPYGSTPKLGAIACWTGHVSVVENINGNSIITSESNWSGRTNPEKAFQIKTYSPDMN